MKAALTLILSYSLTFAAQTVTVMPLASEPHHRLSLHNEYVNVYQVQVAPHDSVLLHRHDFDAISVMLSDAQVTVNTPGRPGSTANLRPFRSGFSPAATCMRLTSMETRRTETSPFFFPQKQGHNSCSEVIPDKPLNCPCNLSTPQVG